MAEPRASGRAGRPRLRFPPAARIRRRRDFERALRDGRRLTDGRLTAWGVPNGLATTRLGLIVGRKHGTAVQRNRLRRLLREAFRLSRPELPAGLDLVCTPRAGAALDLESCRRSLVALAGRLARRLEPREG